MARKPTIKFNKAGERKLKKEVKENLESIYAQAESEAAKKSSPADKASAYVKVLKKSGRVPVDAAFARRVRRDFEARAAGK